MSIPTPNMEPKLRLYECKYRSEVDDASYSFMLEATSQLDAAVKLLELKETVQLTGNVLVSTITQ